MTQVFLLSILPARGQDASTFGNCQKVSRPACLNLLDTARQLRQKPLAKKQVWGETSYDTRLIGFNFNGGGVML